MSPATLASVGLLFAAVACGPGEARVPGQRPNIPQFTAGDSVVLNVPAVIARAGHLLGVFELNDSVIVVLSSAPGGVVPVRGNGVQMQPPAALRTVRPAFAAPCTQGGIVVVTQPDRQAIAIGSSGAVTPTLRVPASVGKIIGMQCESGRDLIALVDGTIPQSTGAALVRVGAALLRLSGEGRVDTLGAFPGRELLRLSAADSGTEPPFAVTTRFAAGPTRIYLANTSEPTIQELQTNGRQLTSFDIVRDRRRVTREQIDSALSASLDPRLAALGSEARDALAEAMAQDRLVPLWKALVIDPDENIWVSSQEPPDSDGDRLWMVYGTDGARRARVFLPHDFEITQVGKDFVLGFYRYAPPASASRRFGLRMLGSL
ncbi:MAG: hypothetical protein MNPFHGCM_02442 [Gemmatimonadaceae bacterium]|nr:hypothetical protein [Gemmatimonadaceae bacterium]